MLLLSAALLLGMQTAPDPVKVHVDDQNKACQFRVDGRLFTLDELARSARGWAAEGREGQVHGEHGVSHQCAGDASATLRASGMARIGYFDAIFGAGFLVTVRGPGCVVLIDGAPVAMERLREEARRWAGDEANVFFWVEPKVSSGCGDPVRDLLFDSHGIALNEITDAGDIMQ